MASITSTKDPASVDIGNSPDVNVVNQPTVDIGNEPNVNVVNTPQVELLSSQIEDIVSKSNLVTFPLMGFNPNVGTSNELISPNSSGSLTPVSGGTLSIVSTSAQDLPAGTGASAVTIVGTRSIGGIRTASVETVTLNGTTPVTTATTNWFSVNKLIFPFSDPNKNAGDITVTSGSQVYAFSQAGSAGSQTALFCAEDSTEALITQLDIFATASSASVVDVYMFFEFGSVEPVPSIGKNSYYKKWVLDTSVQSSISFSFDSPIRIPLGSRVWFEAKSSVSGANVGVNAQIALASA